MVATPTQIVNAPRQRPAKLAWPWVIVVVGYFLPCLIGICVWVYLQDAGKPVMGFQWILRAIPMFVMFSLFWVLPFVAVALAASYLPLAQRKYRGLVYGAFLGTALFEILLFGYAWLNVEIVVMGFLFLAVAIFAGTLAGASVGFLIGWYFQKTKTSSS
jgi:hypothetical protein